MAEYNACNHQKDYFPCHAHLLNDADFGSLKYC